MDDGELSGARGREAAPNHDAPSIVLDLWDDVFLLVYRLKMQDAKEAIQLYFHRRFFPSSSGVSRCFLANVRHAEFFFLFEE